MSDLASKKCLPCRAGTPPMTRDEAEKFLPQVSGWELVEKENGQLRIKRVFQLPDFKQAMELANKIADIAEQQDHHPVLNVSYGRLRVEIVSHIIKGLSESDFILAAKINKIE
ncbi:4a-hydroxytetrahydrobiopterin dehydratase [Candidatus Daviesbacteria bacterium]|nr:4a-hydroxytetrahydrobiopterin dehydratase [Candidatus Daviesbacteria bacterium]